MLYLISYDLKNPGKNYNSLYEQIKVLGNSWWHYMDSLWLVQTNMNIDEFNSRLKPFIDENDLVLIVDITHSTRQGWLPPKAWDWIQDHCM